MLQVHVKNAKVSRFYLEKIIDMNSEHEPRPNALHISADSQQRIRKVSLLWKLKKYLPYVYFFGLFLKWYVSSWFTIRELMYAEDIWICDFFDAWVLLSPWLFLKYYKSSKFQEPTFNIFIDFLWWQIANKVVMLIFVDMIHEARQYSEWVRYPYHKN